MNWVERQKNPNYCILDEGIKANLKDHGLLELKTGIELPQFIKDIILSSFIYGENTLVPFITDPIVQILGNEEG